jgi:Ser/Thr protein kinase RdoA (MazF antagonist)
MRLHPLNVVARALSLVDADDVNRLIRELEVAAHLARVDAPVVTPSSEPPAGPHIHGEFVFTLWQFVEHVAAEDDNPEHVARAGASLRRVHRSLASYCGKLPDLWGKLGRCRALLENEACLPALHPADRTFLLKAFDRIWPVVTSMPAGVPIPGDAHLGNVLITRDGACWSDLEDVCIGPLEWDISCLPDSSLSTFEPIDCDLLATLRDLRSLCVSVWCWDRFDLPEKREAAKYHLAYLKGSGRFAP